MARRARPGGPLALALQLLLRGLAAAAAAAAAARAPLRRPQQARGARVRLRRRVREAGHSQVNCGENTQFGKHFEKKINKSKTWL